MSSPKQHQQNWAQLVPIRALCGVDTNDKDTFTLLAFWRANEDAIPAFSFVLCAVLAHSPNSVPPERVFSILNNAFDDDQDSSRADYIELSMQLPFNRRSHESDPPSL